MIDTPTATLAAALTALSRVQKLTKTTRDPEAVIELTADATGTVRATHRRPDGHFSIAVAGATGDGDTHRVSLRHLRASIAASADDATLTLDRADYGRTRIAAPGAPTVDAPRLPAPRQLTPGIDYPASRRADLGTDGMTSILRVSVAAADRGQSLDTVAIWQRAGYVEASASNRYVMSADRITTGGLAREGNAEAPVLIDPLTISRLAKLPGPVSLTMTAAPADSPNDFGTGSYRFDAPTWTLERRSTRAYCVRLNPLLARENFDTSRAVELSAAALRRAITRADAGNGSITAHWHTTDTGALQLHLSSTDADPRTYVVDTSAVSATSAGRDPAIPMRLHPGNLKKFIAGLDTIRLTQGHHLDYPEVQRLWLDHDTGTGTLISYDD